MGTFLDTNEYEFKDMTLLLNSVPLTAIEEVSFYKRVEKQFVYGEREYPIGVTQGLYSFGGNIIVRQTDFERINFLGAYDILDFDTFVINVLFRKEGSATPTLYSAINVAFTGYDVNRDINDSYGLITLPFICENITLLNARLTPRNVIPDRI